MLFDSVAPLVKTTSLLNRLLSVSRATRAHFPQLFRLPAERDALLARVAKVAQEVGQHRVQHSRVHGRRRLHIQIRRRAVSSHGVDAKARLTASAGLPCPSREPRAARAHRRGRARASVLARRRTRQRGGLSAAEYRPRQVLGGRAASAEEPAAGGRRRARRGEQAAKVVEGCESEEHRRRIDGGAADASDDEDALKQPA